MKGEILRLFPHIWMTCGALVIFFCLFTAAVFWVFRRSGKSIYHQIEQLPLTDGDLK